MVQESGEGYTPHTLLVTGGAGFIASHLVIRLINKYPHYRVRSTHRSGQCTCNFLDVARRDCWQKSCGTAYMYAAHSVGGECTACFCCGHCLVDHRLLPRNLPPPCDAQIVVFDKLDYCGSLKNLASVLDKPNFKVHLRLLLAF